MDPEIGIGYNNLGSPQEDQTLDHIISQTNHEKLPAIQIQYTALHHFLLKGIIAEEIIRLEEFEALRHEVALPLPNTFSVLLRFWNNHPVIENAGGCSANTLLGRFTLASEELEKFAREIVSIEERANPNILFLIFPIRLKNRLII